MKATHKSSEVPKGLREGKEEGTKGRAQDSTRFMGQGARKEPAKETDQEQPGRWGENQGRQDPRSREKEGF